jgi:hypothetical protein
VARSVRRSTATFHTTPLGTSFRQYFQHLLSLPQIIYALMGWSRADKEKTRVARSANRHKRVSIGKLCAALDWKCPHCNQWFSKRRNGPAHHTQKCSATKNFLCRICRSASISSSKGRSTCSSTSISEDLDKSSSESYSGSESAQDSSGGVYSSEIIKSRTRKSKAHPHLIDCMLCLKL